ncbi:Ubiquinone biosynthesis regulatory protein kinase UbiB [hydrothermal vent metagenome]|uniref:Ubiquinone biosynthesis regulatory protein kinase UbiB n=1 Tax=hydrothermal vent metagenome TaxID=652676 RepID=A0A3B0YYB9_9ZZZZ
MIRPGQILHLLRINRVFVRHGLTEFLKDTRLIRPYQFFAWFTPWNLFRKHSTPRAERLRLALQELGPIFIKFGQILSTRKDLLPDDISAGLAELQDNVAPFSGELAKKIIEQAYRKPLSEIFHEFDQTPLASASIAQVHSAIMENGNPVVIKVLRPGILSQIKRDLSLMYYIAELTERFWQDGKRLRPIEVVQEFDKIIHNELDFVREAGNASQLRHNFVGNEKLYIPEIYWPLVTRNVITMERIFGTRISDMDSLQQQGVDFKKLAEDGVNIFYTQVFKHNFFHADMHPGNIFVAANGTYIAVDFGIMGTLNVRDQRYLAENFVAFFNRDYARVAALHIESGWVPEDTREDEFESAIRAVCEPNFNKPLKDISFAQVLLRLFETARQFDMQVQPQLVLLQKTLLNIEGLGRQLYPDLDLWKTAKPFLEQWMHEQLGVKKFVSEFKREFPRVLEKLPRLPLMLYDYLEKHNSGEQTIKLDKTQRHHFEKLIQASTQKIVLSIAGCGLLIVSIILIIIQNKSPLEFILAGISGISALALIFSAFRK